MDADKNAFWLMKDFRRAIREFGMLRPGDRVAVAVSGGKDSLTLLNLLRLLQQDPREQIELVAIHVIGDSRGALEHPHLPLVEHLAQSVVHYAVVPLRLPEGEPLPLNCHRCSWNRRRTLFEAAREQGCSVIALGHHADDIAQTTLLNLSYHGKLEAIAPVREYFGGEIRVIRPLCLLEESEIRRYARSAGFPEPPPACPQEDHSRRQMVRNWLRETGRDARRIKANLMQAGLRGLAEGSPGEES